MSIADHLNEVARFQARIDEMTAGPRAMLEMTRLDRELLGRNPPRTGASGGRPADSGLSWGSHS